MRKKYCFLLFCLLKVAMGLSQVVYVVDSTGDRGDVDLADFHCADRNGKCTLRAAIENANKSFKKDKVHFNIPGKGPFEIILQENLPKITEPLELDATTQPSYSEGSPEIIINGKNISHYKKRFDEDNSPIGFHLAGSSGGSTIKGFVIGGFGYTNNAVSHHNMVYNPGTGVFIKTEKNIIQSNFIGLSANGNSNFSNLFGIMIIASNNLIGGEKPEHKNVISDNRNSGILIHSNTLIKGNFIGTNAGGNRALGNLYGITLVVHSENNIIENNLISGNEAGIHITGDKNYIFNNRIGTNSGGTESIPNKIGIKLHGARESIVGKGNLISGNEIGIMITSHILETGQNNHVWGNLIGTGPKGKQPVSNETGILIAGGNSNKIGGSNQGNRNIISGNNGAGIQLVNAKENIISGNFIGTTVSGKKALPNSIGIEFSGESEKELNINNVIYENLISGNKEDGVRLYYAKGNSVFDNFIGTAINGSSPLPNAGNGVKLASDTFNNCIGSTDPGDMNTIAHNKENGIFIISPAGQKTAPLKNQILLNNIFGNKNFSLLINEKEDWKAGEVKK